MCVSAEVSFGSAAALVAIGAWCLHTTLRRAPWFWPFAVVPGLFGVQQTFEGFVWWGLLHQAPRVVWLATVVYLFFAVAFWPTWFSLAAALIEPAPARRRLLLIWTALSLVWFFAFYLPLFGEFGPPTAEVVYHSIRYEYADSGGLWQDPAARWAERVLYVLTAAIPALVSSLRGVLLIPVMSSVLAAAGAAILFDHAFTSVWCLCSALISATLVHAVVLVPENPPQQITATDR